MAEVVFYFYKYWNSNKERNLSLFEKEHEVGEQSFSNLKIVDSYFSVVDRISQKLKVNNETEETWILLKQKSSIPKKKYYVFQLAKESAKPVYTIDTEVNQVKKTFVENNPYVLVLVDVENQTIAMQKNKSYKKTIEVFRLILEEQVFNSKIEINGMKDKSALTNVFKKHKVTEIEFVFSMPNMFGSQKALNAYLENNKKDTNCEKITTKLENKNVGLENKNGVFEIEDSYIRDGGGIWKVKVEGGASITSESQTYIRTATLSEKTIIGLQEETEQLRLKGIGGNSYEQELEQLFEFGKHEVDL